MSDNFTPASPDLFFKSTKTGDPRLGELVNTTEASAHAGAFHIAGYPDNEGILLNSGRPGAALAPDAIRSRLYKMSTTQFHPKNLDLRDLGNIDVSRPLADRHQSAKESVAEVLKQNGRWIGLGGGHDYGYPDGAGFLNANKDSKLKPLIINFDAHLDVRPTDKGLSSGTPFYRLISEFDPTEFDFYEIGIQRQCNSQSHIQWARDHGVNILFYEDMLMSGRPISQVILDHLSELLVQPRPTYVSVDIDAFSTAYAMGCSQAWPTGFSPNELFPVLNILFRRLQVQVLGIYEVSPPLDADERTVKLAAQIIHQFIGPIH